MRWSKYVPFCLSCFFSESVFVCVWRRAHEPKRVWRARQTERERRNEKEKERGQTYSSLPWIHWLSHCRWRAFFMLHCYTVLFTALLFMTLLPKDVGVLRRPLTVINITGCPSPTDIWVLLRRHYTSFFSGRVMATATRHARVHVEGPQNIQSSCLFLYLFFILLSLSSTFYLSFCHSLLPFRSLFSPPPSKTLTHM